MGTRGTSVFDVEIPVSGLHFSSFSSAIKLQTRPESQTVIQQPDSISSKDDKAHKLVRHGTTPQGQRLGSD